MTKMNVSVAFKLTFARFINSSLVLLMVNTTPKTWFKAGDLVYDAQILILILAFSAPAVEVVNLPGIIRWFRVKWEIRKGDDSVMTQREANILCEGSTIDVANALSNYMNMIMTACFYSPLIPQAIPIALVSSTVGYWITKYHLLRRCKLPDMFSELMASFFSNMMPWLVLAWTLSTYFFFLTFRNET